MGRVGGWVAVVVLLTAWPGWVLCSCAAPLMVGRTVLVCAPPHGGACCVGMWPPPWWGVLRWFVVPLLVGRAVLVRAPLMVGRVVSACAPPPRGGACCVGVCPPPGVGRAALASELLVVGRAALVLGLPLGRACRVGACPPRSWCVVWGVVICSVGCGHRCVVGLAGVGVCPLPCWGVQCLCVAPPWWGVLCRRFRVSVRGVVAGWMPGWFCWFAVVCAAVRPALSGVGCLWCWPGRGCVVVCFLGTRLHSCASLFLKIRNPKSQSTNLAGSLDGAPMITQSRRHKPCSRSKYLTALIHSWHSMLLYYSQTVSAIATAICDLRAVALLRCAVALLLFEAITLPPR